MAPAASRGADSKPATYKLVREIPVETGYDVVVAGGGHAGVAAAVCAARLGAKVLLVEEAGCLGGMATSAMVNTFGPMANGERNLAGGFMLELAETMHRRGFMPSNVTPDWWLKANLKWIPFKLEGLKLVFDELTAKAGVEVRFFTRVTDVDSGRKPRVIDGLIIQNTEGYHCIRAKTFIDCTGDAVVAGLAGAPCRVAGRDTPHAMPGSLPSLLAGVNFKEFKQSKGQSLLEQAVKDGFFTQPDRHFPGVTRVGESVAYLNGGHIFGIDALNCKSMTEGAKFGRRLTQEYLAFCRKYLPGMENVELVTTAPAVGIRESRRIVGEYELTAKDFMVRREFSDQISVYGRPLDVHPYDASPEQYERYLQDFQREGRLNPGEYYGVPYGVLVPKGWKNLWAAGRCVSCDNRVLGSVRAQPSCSMLGQAAGTAAVQSVRTGQPANELDTEELVTTLRKAGAYLPQPHTTKSMTRSA